MDPNRWWRRLVAEIADTPPRVCVVMGLTGAATMPLVNLVLATLFG